jgi:hypothetical protein
MEPQLLPPDTWAQAQFGAAQLGHKRRTRRLVRLAAQVAADTAAGLPEATGSWADLKAAYRLCDQPRVTFRAVAQAHWDRTRAAAAGTVLILDDTTEIDFGPTRRIAGLGPVGSGTGRGFLLHSGLVVAADSEAVLGLAGQILFHRVPAPEGETRAQRRHRDRESQVWGRLIEQIGSPPPAARFIHVMDRGSDDFEVFCRARRQGVDWVSRLKSRHRLVRDAAGVAQELQAALSRQPVAGEFPLELRARRDQPARTARIAVSWAAVAMLPPRQPADSLKALGPQPLPLVVVWARELDPPAGVKEPIDWVLGTSRPVPDFEAARQIIAIYEKRWLIEEWHKALKTGCRVTAAQLKTSGRLEALVGLLSVVAVRLLQLKGVARTAPERPATAAVPPRWVEVLGRVRGVAGSPSWGVGQFFRELAKLGGFLGRKHDGEPGWQTLWRGWEKLQLMLRGFDAAEATPQAGGTSYG